MAWRAADADGVSAGRTAALAAAVASETRRNGNGRRRAAKPRALALGPRLAGDALFRN